MKPNSSSPSDLAPFPDIPDEIIEKILSLIDSDRDRNSASLVRKDWYEAERWTRTSLFVRNRFPVSCPQMVARRFPRITTVKLQGNPDKFSLFGWDGSNDLYPWLVMFAKVYPFLEELRVDTMTVGDDSLELLAESFPSLKALSLASCSGYSYEGIKTIRKHCKLDTGSIVEVDDRFDVMGLLENLHRGIYAYGFEKPSAIQKRWILPFCKGLYVIQQAQSGTHKIATFCSGILQQLDYSVVECQALVLAPTRELARKIEKVMRALGDYLGVKVHACVGGTNVREDQRILSSGVHVVVGTPGRVYHMLRRQSLRPDYIKMFVLDGVDEMLSRGFKDQAYFPKSKPEDPKAQWQKTQFLEMRRRERKLGKLIQTRVQNSKQAMVRGGRVSSRGR